MERLALPRQLVNQILQQAQASPETEICGLITARNEKEAHEFAAQNPPAEEFVVSLHPQTDDQLLGSVRQNASRPRQARKSSIPDGAGMPQSSTTRSYSLMSISSSAVSPSAAGSTA